jgi:hypothetical protein
LGVGVDSRERMKGCRKMAIQPDAIARAILHAAAPQSSRYAGFRNKRFLKIETRVNLPIPMNDAIAEQRRNPMIETPLMEKWSKKRSFAQGVSATP